MVVVVVVVVVVVAVVVAVAAAVVVVVLIVMLVSIVIVVVVVAVEVLFWLLLTDFSVFSMRLSAFSLVCAWVVSEVQERVFAVSAGKFGAREPG